MSPEFVMSFLDPHVMSAFKNLSFLCEYVARNNNDVVRALMDMRKTEAMRLMNRAASSGEPTGIAGAVGVIAAPTANEVVFGEIEREFDFMYVYEIHRLAHIVTTFLGFASIFDKHVLANCDVERRVDDLMPRITKMYPAIKSQFKLPPVKNGVMDAHIFLDTVKAILEDT